MNLKEEFKLKPIPKSKQGNRRKATRNLKRASQYKDVNKILHNANRSALDEDVIEAQKVSESYQKIMTADFVVSLSRKVEDKIGNTGRFHVIKNRFGPDGITYPAKVNTNTGAVEIYESTSVGGKEQQKKIDNRDNLMKKMLANKYDDMMNE